MINSTWFLKKQLASSVEKVDIVDTEYGTNPFSVPKNVFSLFTDHREIGSPCF